MTKNNLQRTPKQQKNLKILSGLVIGGSILGMTAILFSMPLSSNESTQKIEPAPAQSTAWRQEFEPLPSETVEAVEAPEPIEIATPEKVEAKRPVVAIAHEEVDVDFEAQAKAMIGEGDLRGAFTQLRKHLYTSAPTPQVLFTVGQLGRQLKEYAVAEQALMDCAALDTDRAEVQTELARVRLAAGDLEEARHAVRQAIRIDPRDPIAWNVAGRVAMASSEFHRAAQAFDESLDLDPTTPIVHNNAGLNFVYMKRGPDAVDALETAVELYDDDTPHFVFNNLGLAHELAGNFEESREAFEEALLLSPFYARAKVNLERVEQTIASLEEENAFETAQGVTMEEVEPSAEEMIEDEIIAADET